MRKYIISFVEIFNKSIEIICIIAITVSLATVLSQVFVRYVLRLGFAWVEEVTNYMLVVIAIFGACLNLYENNDINLRLIIDRFNPKLKNIINLFTYLFILLFLAFLIKYGYAFSLQGLKRDSITLGIKMYIPFLIIPVGGVTIAINVMYKIYSNLYKYLKHK